MPLYQYAAMDATGRERKGQKEAANEEAVTAFLKEQGMFPTSIKQVRKLEQKKAVKQPKKAGDKKKSAMNININISLGPAVIKTKQLTIFTRQLAILLNAGLPLIRSLRTLEKQSKDPIIKKILGEVALPAYGLMSDQDASTTTEQIHHLETMLHTLGVRKTIDLVNLTFVALPVIPSIRLLDTGLYDVDERKFID